MRARWQLLVALAVLAVGGTAAAQLEGPPHHGMHGPPQAAIDACASLRAGDSCSFKMDGRQVDGVCRAGPEGRAACAPKDMPPPPPPPKAALDACASLRSGDGCSFSIDGHQMDGVCRSGPDHGPLGCAPKMHGPPPPPKVAFDACSNLRVGDTCTFSVGGQQMTGTCRAGPDNGPVACAPKDMPPPPMPPKAAIDACASLRSGDSCSFTMAGRSLDGVCRAGPDNGAIACAPRDMPPPPDRR